MVARIAQHPVEIYECVVGVARPNPVIDGLTLGFQLGRPQTGKRVPFNRVQCPADCLEPKRMSAIDDLTMPLDDLLDAHNFRRIAEQGRNDEVGVTLQHDDVLSARLHEHIAIEAREGVRADEIVQDPIAWQARVQHGDL